ncbi:LuxR family transcriptional regulator [Novosphingobium sp. YAF33]|uniref:LuxR family transcriptional regulator n=1 Tax=Novosphingobium sp. YAF33 TaxID=3233082 RepID=UPI003F9B042A
MTHLVSIFETIGSIDDLTEAMSEATEELGFQRFALSHHGGFLDPAGETFRIHNYPDQWAEFYDQFGLGLNDPVHRASNVTNLGFRWERIPHLIPMTEGDRRVLTMAREQGIVHGYTVPGYVPGEWRGSLSFVNSVSVPIYDPILPIVQSIALFAFDAARGLWLGRGASRLIEPARLTDRQREILVLVAWGMNDREIAKYLGRSEETIALHVRNVCGRYGVNKRTLAVIRALLDGNLTFTDILRR